MANIRLFSMVRATSGGADEGEERGRGRGAEVAVAVAGAPQEQQPLQQQPQARQLKGDVRAACMPAH